MLFFSFVYPISLCSTLLLNFLCLNLEEHSCYWPWPSSWFSIWHLCYLPSGLSNLTNLSFRRNGAITSHGMSAFANLFGLIKLDLERCPGIHGGLVHLQGTSASMHSSENWTLILVIWKRKIYDIEHEEKTVTRDLYYNALICPAAQVDLVLLSIQFNIHISDECFWSNEWVNVWVGYSFQYTYGIHVFMCDPIMKYLGLYEQQYNHGGKTRLWVILNMCL